MLAFLLFCFRASCVQSLSTVVHFYLIYPIYPAQAVLFFKEEPEGGAPSSYGDTVGAAHSGVFRTMC